MKHFQSISVLKDSYIIYSMRHPRIALLLCMLYVFFMGCQSTKEYSYLADDVSSYRDKKITAVTLKNGDLYKYDKVGGRFVEEKKDNSTFKEIVGFDQLGAALNFELGKVLEVQCQSTESNGGGVILGILLGAVAGGLILLLILLASFSGLRT